MGAPAKKATGRTTPKGTQPAGLTAFDRLKSRKGITRRLPVYLDSEITDEFEAAKGEFDDLNSNEILKRRTSEERQGEIVARYQAASAAMEDNTLTLVLKRPLIHVQEDEDGDEVVVPTAAPDGTTRTLKGRQAYEWIVSAHPPTDEQLEEWKAENSDREGAPTAQPPYDPNTFAPALVSACMVEPDLTAEQVMELMDEWTITEAMTLFHTAMEICNGTQIASLGKGSGGMSGF